MGKKKEIRKNIVLGTVGFIVLVCLLFFLRGNIYQMIVKYEDDGNRKSYDIKNDALMTVINQSLPNDETLDLTIDVDQIIDISLGLTSDLLEYVPESKEKEPQKTFVAGYADYIGFAAFNASIADYLLKRFGMNKEWEVKPKKAKLYIFGANKTKKAQDGWFKDHDIVVFKNKTTKEEIYVDPSAYKSFGVGKVNKYEK
ncbi:MAG: hypothetical protein LBV43_06635 [Prevotella sp.]|jgi:hypothetical protein|nr:hypothetical protein [Prevotella sp.]